MAKKISYYELLQSKRDDDIMNIPVTALKLSQKASFQVQKFGTVGNLVSFGKTPLMGQLTTKFRRYDEMSDTIFEIEEALAKLGLKLEGSDFTVGDVRVEKLGLVREAEKVITKLQHKIQTLDDLVIFGALRLSRNIPENKTITILEISQALEKYGLKLEGSPYRISEERFFPLNDYLKYLPEERRKQVTNIKQADIHRSCFARPKVNLLGLSHEELLETSVEELTLSPTIKQSFDRNNIKTIGELINTSESKVKRYLSHDQFCTIENVLASVNLRFKDSSREIVNGKVIRSKTTRLLSTAPKKQDVTNLPKEEQDKFLDTPILEFGFAPHIAKYFENQDKFITIRDLTNADRNTILKTINNISTIQTIRVILSDYGLSFKKPEKQLIVSKYIDEVKIKANDIPTLISDKQKEEYKSIRLEDAGFTPVFIETIARTGIKVETIGDAISHTRSEYYRRGLSDAQIVAMRKILNHYGHTVPNDVSMGRTKETKVEKVNLSEEETKKLIKSSLHAIGLYTSVIDTLKNNGNIETVEDLIFCSKSEIRNYVNLNIYAYNTINSQLSKYGLKLMTADQKKKLEKEKKAKELAQSSQNSAITYAKRQEEHYKLAKAYLEQRKQNVRPRNKVLFDSDFSEKI